MWYHCTMTTIHIDESGTIGMKERYFVIAALITDNPVGEKRLKRIVKRSKVSFRGTPLFDELHASLMNGTQKKNFLVKIHTVDEYKVAYLIADKNHIDPKLYASKNLCFNYLFATLAKSLLATIDDDVEFCVDNRTVKVTSVNSLGDYVKIQALTSWGFKHNIAITLRDSKTCHLLQTVDVIANSLYAKYNYDNEDLYGINSDRLLLKEYFPRAKFGS